MSKNIFWFILVILNFCIVTSISDYEVVQFNKTVSNITLLLKYTGTDQFYIKNTSPIIKNLIFTFKLHSYSDFCIKITDADKPRFQVPQQHPWPSDPLSSSTYPLDFSAVRFEYNQKPFDFRVIRRQNNSTLFSTFDKKIIFSDFYIQIGTEVDTSYIYGLGERFEQSFKKKTGKWTIFNRGRGKSIDRGTGFNTYGFYPIYLLRQNNNFFHFNYFRNSNAMDVLISQENNKTYVQYKVIGGIIDFRFVLGSQSMIYTQRKFNQFIGASTIPPFWSLGMHQSKWGYTNVSMLKQVIKNYEINNIPLDTIWSDIDYMKDYEDFTIDQARFPLNQMKQITDKYHYIPIIDAGIKVSNGTPYLQGKKRNIFVKTAQGKQYQGKVWPGNTTFVDFFHPNSTTYWKDMLQILYEKVQFSGVWLDMNQYANFCDGTCDSTPVQSGGFDYSKDLPYNPGSQNVETHTISLNTSHYNNIIEANVHSFNGMLQTYATSRFLQIKGKKPFIITRSSTLGTHKFGFHWTGDNAATWDFLKSSIIDNFNFQMWGVQMVGPDICGFDGNTTEQLCSRWYQLATLYPFARNHNSHTARSQEPYALGNIVLKAAQTNVHLRYSLLKYYYSYMIISSGTGAIFQPLFFVYPNDDNVYLDQFCDTQFILGLDLMATPILQPNTTSRNIYLPGSSWYQLYTGKKYPKGVSSIQNVSLTDKLPLFIKEGRAVFVQNTTKVRQTKDLDNVFQIIGAFVLYKQNTTTNTKLYRIVSQLISIQDYSNEVKLSECVNQNCIYGFFLDLQITPSSKNLKFTAQYLGVKGLNQLILIDRLRLYLEGDVIQVNLENKKLSIKGDSQFDIPLNFQTLNLKKQFRKETS